MPDISAVLSIKILSSHKVDKAFHELPHDHRYKVSQFLSSSVCLATKGTHHATMKTKMLLFCLRVSYMIKTIRNLIMR